MIYVRVLNLVKKFGNVAAVDDVSFDIDQGELFTLLGPSGCGKSTTLRCIAGLERPNSGEIWIKEKAVVSVDKGVMVPAEKRNLSMVFQSYAVWPHMSVFDNVAYGLEVQKRPKEEIKERVLATLNLVGLQGLENRSATMLSGGQQQRVALARSLVMKRELLLLDEPLSNLDVKLREQMRLELKTLHGKLGLTAVYVTHDQAEAMSLSDRIAVMNQGKIEQISPPRDLYRNPVSKFVADFIGRANLLEGKITSISAKGNSGEIQVGEVALTFSQIASGFQKGSSVVACVRPEDISISAEGFPGKPNVVRSKVMKAVYIGNMTEYQLQIYGYDKEVRVEQLGSGTVAEGKDVYIHIPPASLKFIGS